jgi:hypothetical protein
MSNLDQNAVRGGSREAGPGNAPGRGGPGEEATPGKRTLTQDLAMNGGGDLAYGGTPTPGPANAKLAGDPNTTVLANGFDPMIPTSVVDASRGQSNPIVAYLRDIVTAFYAQPGQQGAASPARVHQSTAADRFQAMFNEEMAAHNQAAAVSATKRWNTAVRGAAIERVVGSYLAIPVVLPGGISIAFRTPYNINEGDEIGGKNVGKNSPKDMATEAQALINGGSLEQFLPARTKGQTVAMQISQLAQQPIGMGLLSQAVTAMCRQRRLGVDCSGFVFHAVDQADQLLGGKGWPKEQVTATTLGADVMTGDKWSRAVALTEVAPGDVLRFEPAGHHIAIVTRAAAIPGGMRLGLAHSNEAYFLDPADGVFVGDVDLASADSPDAIGARLKAAIPVIMGDSSTFVGFRRLATRFDSKDDKKLGDSRFG